jgi:hypothetical protein
MIRIVLGLLASAALLAGPALAQEAAATRRATEVREAPGDNARSLAALPAQAVVTRTGERRGPWVQVRTANGVSGWLHLFDLGPAGATESSGSALGGALRGVTGLLGGGRPSQAGTTAGIRGLGAEDLARAQPNPYEVAQMEKLRLGESEARSFAESAGLHPVAVAPLPGPVRAQPAPQGERQETQLP